MADSEKVLQLVELGLNGDDAAAALIKTGNNVEQAIALIFEEPRYSKTAESGTKLFSEYRSRYARGYSKESFCG
jgi:uncharacterized UBP type Zn finger protein